MNRWLLTRMLKWGEKQIGGVSMDYAYRLRDILPSRLWRFAMIKVVEGPRKFTPPEVFHAAGLAAAMVEDCGPCVQIHVNLALQEKVDAATLRQLVAGKVDQAPADAALAFRYGDAIARGIMAEELRDQILLRWGEKGLVELAFVVATARFYPAIKRGMGYAHTCERVVIHDQETQAVKAA
jgi:AhpD family alkylhydroperoxidase